MPGHWLPWPGKTSTGRVPPGGAVPVTMAGWGCPPARAASPARDLVPPVPASDGPVLELGPRGGQRVPDLALGAASGRPSATPCSRRAAAPQPRAGVRPDSGHITGLSSGSGAWPLRTAVSRALPGSSPCCPAGAGWGGCSRMRWALVPLMPKEDTPARRGRPVVGPGRRLGQQRAPCPAYQSTCGVGSSDVQGRRQHAVPHGHAPS